MVPVIEALARSGVLVSIDTRKAAVMRAAIAAGARHDQRRLRPAARPGEPAVAGASGLPVVLMHSQGEPATMQRAADLRPARRSTCSTTSQQRIAAWTAAGFERARLLIDPGIGFGKTVDHNLEILSRLGLYLGLGLPLLLGVSRKSFIAPARRRRRTPADACRGRSRRRWPALAAGRRRAAGPRCRRDATGVADLAALRS